MRPACRPSTSPACPAPRWACSIWARCSARRSASKTKRKKLIVAQSYDVLLARRATSCWIRSRSPARRIQATEQNGIVFLDEIDKISAREGRMGADVSREGVQRDLLPLIEGTTVSTKHGAGQDRPHPVHRQRRLPPRASPRTCCPSCRAACRSGSSCSRSAARISPASWSSPRPAWSSSTPR